MSTIIKIWNCLILCQFHSETQADLSLWNVALFFKPTCMIDTCRGFTGINFKYTMYRAMAWISLI